MIYVFDDGSIVYDGDTITKVLGQFYGGGTIWIGRW